MIAFVVGLVVGFTVGFLACAVLSFARQMRNA